MGSKCDLNTLSNGAGPVVRYFTATQNPRKGLIQDLAMVGSWVAVLFAS